MNEICIPTKAAFVRNKDINNEDIYHYEPVLDSKESFDDKRRPRVSINGKLIRIFCRQCTAYSYLRKCRICSQMEVGPQCGKHGECYECAAEDLPLYKCKDCDLTCCKYHKGAGDEYHGRGKGLKSMICRSCGIKREIQDLSE